MTTVTAMAITRKPLSLSLCFLSEGTSSWWTSFYEKKKIRLEKKEEGKRKRSPV